MCGHRCVFSRRACVLVCVCKCSATRVCTAGSQAGIDQHSLDKQKGREEEDNLKTKDKKKYYKGVTDLLRHAKCAVHSWNTRTPLAFAVSPEYVEVAPPLLICSCCVFRKQVSP